MDDPHAENRVADSDKNELLDRLSKLPDSLILMILSLLPMRHVVQTTILSKRWKDLWTTIPCLDFKNPKFKNIAIYDFLDSKNENLCKLRNFVCGALARWRGTKILKFCVDFTFHFSCTHDLDSWLDFAIKNHVEELHVGLLSESIFKEESKYYAPKRLYSCSSITKLSLVYCGLEIGEDVEWNQLKSLTIQSRESLTRVMKHLISGAPQLEVLDLTFSHIDESLNIESTSLKVLEIRRTLDILSDDIGKGTMLSICSPNLETLKISGVSFDECLLNAPSLTNAFLDFRPFVANEPVLDQMVIQVLHSISHVENVTLSDWCIKTLLRMKMKGMAVPSSNAKFLKLIANEADEMLGVLDMFPDLMVLIVDLNIRIILKYLSNPHFTIHDDYMERKCSPTPSLLHLERAEINWHIRDQASITRAIAIILENALLLEKMVFRVCCRGESLPSFAMVEENVLSMPRSSSTAEVIVKEL